MTHPPIADLLDCAKRELALRVKCYPGWVRGGRMSQQKADHEIRCMEGIVERLQMLKTCKEVAEEICGEQENMKL